jgi:uncharacterized membrane protein YeiH
VTPPHIGIEAVRPALVALDYAGVAVFALTGALAAARAKQTIVTFAFFAAITGIGGGTLRDVLIGAPVFWIARPDYLWVCFAAAVVAWFTRSDRWRHGALVWLDAIGMAAFAVVGAAKALDFGTAPLVAFVMGVLTATFGGIIRDVAAGEPSMLLGPEIYITAAALSSGVYVVLVGLGTPTLAAGAIAALAGFALRGAALRYNLKLPGYRR